MARSTLSALIDELRGLTDAGPADYNVGTAVFWDDNQLQLVLDRHRRDIFREYLQVVPDLVGGGSVQYTQYRSQYDNLEQTDGGTAVLFVEDAAGVNIGTATWSADYKQGIVTFAADTRGTAYYMTARTFDLFAAAADVWRVKAGAYAKYYDFSTDNHSMSRSQWHNQCLAMAKYYDGQKAIRTIEIVRGDLC